MDVKEWFFPSVPPSYDASHELLTHFPTDGGTEVPAMIVGAMDGSEEGKRVSISTELGKKVSACTIFFHPNACDIGHCVPEMRLIQKAVFGGDCVMLAPEYPGYGLLQIYEPTVEGIDNVAVAAFHFCQRSLGFKASQIVLWGRSIGSGPAASLACLAAERVADENRRRNAAPSALLSPRNREEKIEEPPSPVGALVLVAPFVSVSAAVASHAGQLISAFVDAMWEVGELLTHQALSTVPLCVVHPEEDELVPKVHGERILTGAATSPKLGVWLKGEGHNFHCERHHLAPVRAFLSRNCADIKISMKEPWPESVASQADKSDTNWRVGITDSLLQWGCGDKQLN